MDLAARARREGPDSQTVALGMALGACLVGWAIHRTGGYYDVGALCAVTAAIAVCVAALLLAPVRVVESISPRVVTLALATAVLIESIQLLRGTRVDAWVIGGTACIGLLGVLQGFALGRLRTPMLGLMLVTFSIVASVVFLNRLRDPRIDVFMFQQMSASGLLHGYDPYAIRFPNLYFDLYLHGELFYGPGVVDAMNQLTVGLPYPPLSLLLVLPGYVLGGDCRFANVVAIAAAAGLIAMTRPSRRTGLLAALFLLTPEVFYLIERAWTESVLALMFSLVMFCALRWRRGLPYALGLFFGTKQYAVLAVPLVWLLMERSDGWRELVGLLAKATLVAIAITAPFFFWDPPAFIRSVVQFQFVQPLRTDALSYLVWMHARFPRLTILPWVPFVMLVPTTALTLWRCRRSPAGFAAACTVVNLVFFAFNKQAYCNYYYFVIATACWASAATYAAVEEHRVLPPWHHGE